MELAVPGDHRPQVKEMEKIDKFLDLIRGLKKKLWSIKVAVIAIAVDALTMVSENLKKKTQEEWKIRGRIESIALLRSTRILRRVLRLAVTHTLVKNAIKNSQGLE